MLQPCTSFLPLVALVFLTMPSPSVQDAKPSCPKGGEWFVCTTGSRFVGCCTDTKDPCDGGCPSGSLRPASYNTTYEGDFADQKCSAGSLFYTCAKTNPPFLGCCKSNPCTSKSGNCPLNDLGAALLSDNATAAADFTATLLPPIATTTASMTSSTMATSSSSTTPSTSAVSSDVHHIRLSTGGVVGVAVGGVVLSLAIAALASVLWQWWSNRHRPRPASGTAVPYFRSTFTSFSPEPRVTPDGKIVRTFTERSSNTSCSVRIQQPIDTTLLPTLDNLIPFNLCRHQRLGSTSWPEVCSESTWGNCFTSTRIF